MAKRKFMENFQLLERFLRNENTRITIKTMVLVFFYGNRIVKTIFQKISVNCLCYMRGGDYNLEEKSNCLESQFCEVSR